MRLIARAMAGIGNGLLLRAALRLELGARLGGHFLGAVEVDLLRPLDRVHQHERLAALHLEHALGHGGDLLDAVGVPQRQLAGNDGEHDILVLRHQAVHTVDARHGERCARPVKKRALGREDAERKGLHHASPLSIFFALASASSSVPTL